MQCCTACRWQRFVVPWHWFHSEALFHCLCYLLVHRFCNFLGKYRTGEAMLGESHIAPWYNFFWSLSSPSVRSMKVISFFLSTVEQKRDGSVLRALVMCLMFILRASTSPPPASTAPAGDLLRSVDLSSPSFQQQRHSLQGRHGHQLAAQEGTSCSPNPHPHPP